MERIKNHGVNYFFNGQCPKCMQCGGIDLTVLNKVGNSPNYKNSLELKCNKCQCEFNIIQRDPMVFDKKVKKNGSLYYYDNNGQLVCPECHA